MSDATKAAGFSLFGRFANAVAHAMARPITFVLCCAAMVAWAASGPLFHFSDTWQLIVGTGTSIVTFLMVFLIQSTQNHHGAALQAKLDELIRVTEAARNNFVGIEKRPEKHLLEIREECAVAVQEADAAAQTP